MKTKTEVLRFFLKVSYKGSHYHGWQRQANAISVQQVLEEALGTLLPSVASVVGAGRTDTGVHARQMFAHFDAELDIKQQNQLPYLLNQLLPKDIAAHALYLVRPDAHARFDALSRTYEYHIAQLKSVFDYDLNYFFRHPLNLTEMNNAAMLLQEFDNFECFSKKHTDVKTFLCEVTHAQWTKSENGYIFTIKANRFLRNMVRAIVGTLIDVGLEKKSTADVKSIVKSKNRSMAGYSVPARGLFLTEIKYPKSIFS